MDDNTRKNHLMFSVTRRSLRALGDANKSSGFGHKLAKGIAIGGLAGGLAGLTIELSPEEYGLKKKANQWLKYGKSLTLAIPAKETSLPKELDHSNSESSPSSPRAMNRVDEQENEGKAIDVPLAAKTVPHVPDEIKPDSVDADHSEEEDEGEEEEEEEKDISSEPVAEPSTIEEIPQSQVVEEGGDEAEVELTEKEDTFDEKQELASQLVKEEQMVESLRLEIKRLQSELLKQQQQHDSDMASAAGATQATLDTLDRLYTERETAVSVAKHGILVNELLYSMALDNTNTSAGALRVDFHRRIDGFILDCFSPAEKAEAGFFKLLLARVLASLYSVHAGDVLTRFKMPNSTTWENLCAVQVAKAAVDRGDFNVAVMHVEMLESDSAKEWVNRTRQAQQLWQGAHAAVASLHDDLSRVF